MFKFNNKEARTMLPVSLLLTLSLTLRILMPLLLTLNIFYILHDVKYAKIRALCWKSNKFNRLQIEVFFLPNISPPFPPIPRRYKTIKLVLCPYIRPIRPYIRIRVLTRFYGIPPNLDDF